MDATRLAVHSIYGAIYRDGEFVQRGAVLGLSSDAARVVTAPISGWVSVLGVQDQEPDALHLEIRINRIDTPSKQ